MTRFLGSHVVFHFLCIIIMLLNDGTICNVVFQPAFILASGPRISSFLVGNVSGISFSISAVSSSNATGSIPLSSCVPVYQTQWNLSYELIGKNAFLVRVSLNRSLQLCGNETSVPDCCPEPLCLQETLLVSACADEAPKASLIIQTHIYAQIFPNKPLSENKTAIPNQVFQPLGSCPCDVSLGECDIRCCCDQDCSQEVLHLFATQCVPGPFGGSFSPVPEYQCSAQSSENDPDWFPFLCVTSPSDNNPFLGLFYDGRTVSPKPSPSFQAPQMTAAVPPINYRQGDPIFTKDDQYFTIPQNSGLGQCADNAPVAFLENFESQCVRRLQSCPSPLDDLRLDVKDGLGGVVTVSVVDEAANDLRLFLSNSLEPISVPQKCDNVVVALSYTLYWRENGLTAITVKRTTANITLPVLTRRYSAVFVNGNETSEPNSGNSGYLVKRPVIGGILDSATEVIQRAQINLWQPGGDGLCSSAELRPALFGINSTSGCVIPVSLLNVRQCSQLRETVRAVLAELVTATLVSTTGNPNFSNLVDWVNITTSLQNSSRPAEGSSGECSAVPTHLHIHVRSVIMGRVQGVPQTVIQAVEISFIETTWRIECDIGRMNPCVNPELMQNFPVTSSVTFTDNPLNTQPPRSRFSINFTEFDCDRNDVCWPELAFPLTRYYTGEPYSQALAKGLILVFFFIAASVLGTPWRQIRQAWNSARL
ncbi:tectonic-2 [Rhinichthys klamathensis goyatoka]|uniref:tectonic-2 n=1 Tax=Rhinichthys klamathensis goyatoka TaxID=3034132 RepID=UPI0024B52600|nr:tectonic-2 [Rhinichthys klamathensis goyatoka]